GGNLEGLWDRFDPGQHMRDGRFEADTTGGDQSDGVFEMGLSADVGKEITQAPLPQEINVQRDGAAEPGDADDLPPRTHRIERLKERLVTGEPLLRAAAGALEDDIGAVAAGQIADRCNYIAGAGVEGMIGAEVAGNLARLVAHVHGDDLARPAEAGDLQALQPHAALAEYHDGVSHAQLGRLHRRHAVAERLQTGCLAVGDPIVHLDEGDFRQDGDLGKTAGEVEPDDRPLAAEVAPLGTPQP